jgi:hypothetical protein
MFLPDLRIPDPGSATPLRLEMASARLLALIGDYVHYTLRIHPVGPVFI